MKLDLPMIDPLFAKVTHEHFTSSFRKHLKTLLNERICLDRRRLEEGLLLYWCLQRLVEYSLKQLHQLVIPAEIDDLIKEVSPLYHGESMKKWISEYKSAYSHLIYLQIYML